MARNRRPLRSVSLNLKEGDSPDELRTAYTCAANTVTHELEDHCPDRLKAVARKNIRQVLDEDGASRPTFVRTSTANDPAILLDLEAIVCPNLYGVMLPKVESAADIHDDDIKIDGRWYVRNKSKCGKLRLDLAAHFGIYPDSSNRKKKFEQVGGIVKAAEAESIGDQGRAKMPTL